MADEYTLDLLNVLAPPVCIDTAIDHSALNTVKVTIIVRDASNDISVTASCNY